MTDFRQPFPSLLALRTTRRGALGLAVAAALAAPAAVRAQGTPVALPETPVGRQIAWLLETLNAGAGDLTAATVEEHFGPDFLASISAEETVGTTQAMAAEIAPVRFAGFAGEPSETEAVATLLSGPLGQAFTLDIAVEPEPPHRIASLLIEPVADSVATPVAVASWDDLDAQLAALAPIAQATAAEIVDGHIQPVHVFNGEEPIAVGSIFKLYILGELARQIGAGEAAWDEPLAIRDDWKSVPAGEMLAEPAGAEFPLRHYAEQMISVSDNTATDHLLFRLGRERVEAMQEPMGNAHAERNLPMLSTRELFALKLALPPERREAYVAAGVEERRAMLAGEVAQAQFPEDAGAQSEPIAIEAIEWFASGEDVARAWAALQAMAAGEPALLEITAINPGLELPAETWRTVGYKGGSEVGVLAGSWLLERADGRWFTFNLGINDPDEAIGEAAQATLFALAEQAIGLLGAAA